MHMGAIEPYLTRECNNRRNAQHALVTDKRCMDRGQRQDWAQVCVVGHTGGGVVGKPRGEGGSVIVLGGTGTNL